MSKKPLLITLLILMPGFMFASQIKDVNHTDTIKIDLSSIDPNIISASSDRIRRFTALKGMVNANIDKDSGELILKPILQNESQPFSMILSTEKGKRYTLFVTPKKIPAQDIILTNNIATPISNSIESRYSVEIAELIKLMIHGRQDKAYSIKKYSDIDEKQELSLLQEYHGNKYKGEMFLFKNKTNKNLILSEQQFYGTNVLAISISEAKLKPNMVTKIYRVAKNG